MEGLAILERQSSPKLMLVEEITENIEYQHTVNCKAWKSEHEKYTRWGSKYGDPLTEWREHTTKTFRKCSKCDQDKLLCNYATNTSGRDPFFAANHPEFPGCRNRRPECKDCGKKEGLTCDIAKKKSKAAGEPTKAPCGTLCELCGTDKNIVYDHDHETCEFRGWLCNPCNRGLGQCGDNIPGLLKRLNYLLSKQDGVDIPIIIQDQGTGMLHVS